MVHILASISARAEGVVEMRDVLVALAGESRQEAGCLSYELYQRSDDPTQFQTVERWRDAAAADAHMATPHVAAAIARAGALFAAPPQILRYDKLA
jgi:quinol monooxygenase YgiN